MIDYLSISKAGYFYLRRKRLTGDAIDALFQEIRNSSLNSSRNIFRIKRRKLDGAQWSAISFRYYRPAPFLTPASKVLDHVSGFLLLVEYQKYIAVFKSGLDFPTSFKSEYLTRVASGDVEIAITRRDAVFEKLRLRNMSVSKLVLRSKTLEADDLQNSIGPAGTSRYVPQAYNVRRDDGRYSATPSTGRISYRSDRADCEDIVRWSIDVINQLRATNEGAASPFIKTFARAIDLASLPKDACPSYLAVNVASLADRLFEWPEEIRLVRIIDGQAAELGRVEVETLIEHIGLNFPISKIKAEFRILDPNRRVKIGIIAVGKARIALKSLAIPTIEGVAVERCQFALGTDPERMPLRRYIDREDLFTVLFNDLALAYLDGSLYRDDALLDGGASLLRHIRVDPLLNAVVSEKGVFAIDQTNFDENSAFGVVVNSISNGDDVLVCDDLGDEWADFIGLNTAANPKTISFYHAKHGDLSLGASPFHISVSQAMKNLGRMALTSESMQKKFASWNNFYENDGVVTAIHRVVRGAAETISDKVEDVRMAPDTFKRVYIVTSSLSRAEVERELQNIANGYAPKPHFVHLYWLLMSFFSACTEVGANGYIICQD